MLQKRLQTTFVYVTHDQTEAMTMADRIVVMDKGVIQQFDTPQMLYNEPANMFVAGFIGSPRMNFINSAIVKDGEKLKARFSGYELTVSKEKAEYLADYIGKEVILGIRPEHFIAAEEITPSKDKCIITVNTEIAEMMGSETNIYFDLDGKQNIAQIKTGKKINPGDRIRLSVDEDHAHFFDPVTSAAIG